MANMISGIISITIGAVLMAQVFIATIKGRNGSCTGNGTVDCWTTSEIALYGLLSLLGIVGILYGVLSVFGLA